MPTDWNKLNDKTREFRVLQIVKDPANTFVEAVFSGLEVKLSEIVSSFAFGGGSSLTIYADTLIIDTPSFDARGVVVVARSVDVSLLQGGAIPVRVPPQGQTAVVELLVQQTVGGGLALTTSEARAGATSFTVPAGLTPLRAAFYFVQPDGSSTSQIKSDASDIQDLIGRSWALNSLRASYTAATWLANSDDASDRATAQSMLGWVVACIRAQAQEGGALPSDYAELYNQAAALLVTLNVAPGAYFVPVLSRDFYKGQIDTLLGALQSYENNLRALDTSTDIQKALQTVGETLQGVAQDEVQPLQTQLTSIQQNIQSLNEGISQLTTQFIIQQQDCTSRFATLRAKILTAKAAQFFEAALQITLAPYKIALDLAKVEEDPAGLGDAMETFTEAVKTGVEAIQEVSSGAPGQSELLDQAKAMLDMQLQLRTSFQAGAVLWNDARSNQTGSELPMSLGAVSIDPNLAWDNYMAKAEAELSSIKDEIRPGTGASEAQAAANEYLASLKILANYGKAIDAKFVALAEQLARATVLKAQITAAQNTQARWKQVEAQARTAEEKLAAMKSLQQGRADAIKRSVYVSWTYYRDSYFYLYFQLPPVKVDVGMSAAQMKDAFASVSQWVARLLGDAPDGQNVQLPNEDVHITLEFDVIRSAGSLSAGQEVALLTPASGGQPAVLTWTIAPGTHQLDGVLPDGGDVAIWIKDVRFFLDGVKPNAKGNVIARVATSGSYENGFGPNHSYSFVTKGLSGNYAYKPTSSTVYDPWSIDTAVYMTPTPFTQWTLRFDPTGGDASEVKKLQMKLVVAYRERSGAGLKAMAVRSAAMVSAGKTPLLGAKAPATPNHYLSFGDDWAQLLAWCQQAERIPADASSFTARYGPFQDAEDVADFSAALAQVQALSRELGGPAALTQALARQPELLSGPTPPKDLYGQILWLAGQVANAASIFQSTLKGLTQVLAPSTGDVAQRGTALKSVLAGEGGLSATAATLRRQCAGARDGLSAFHDRLALVTKRLAGTALLDAANQKIGELGNALPRLRQQAAEAYQKWTGKPLSKATVAERKSSFKLPRAKKTDWEAVYNQLTQEIQDYEAQLARKQQLVNDLKGFFKRGDRVVAAVLDIDNQLRRVQARFEKAGNRMIQVSAISNFEQLSSLDWVSKALDLSTELEKWQLLAEDARAFLSNALVQPPAARTVYDARRGEG